MTYIAKLKISNRSFEFASVSTEDLKRRVLLVLCVDALSSMLFSDADCEYKDDYLVTLEAFLKSCLSNDLSIAFALYMNVTQYEFSFTSNLDDFNNCYKKAMSS